MILELHGLQVFGYHGVEEEEQRLGQIFLFDVELEVGERGADDRLAGAIDYTKVAAAIRELSSARRFDLIEALATAVADLIHERFAPERVRVRVRKPHVKPAGLTVD
ncbi:MAG: dihydroneopterin aldolase, partial [Actinomycetota bacterium]